MSVLGPRDTHGVKWRPTEQAAYPGLGGCAVTPRASKGQGEACLHQGIIACIRGIE